MNKRNFEWKESPATPGTVTILNNLSKNETVTTK